MDEEKTSMRGLMDHLRGKCDECGEDMEGEGCLDHGRKLCRSCFVGPDTFHIPVYSSFGPWTLCR